VSERKRRPAREGLPLIRWSAEEDAQLLALRSQGVRYKSIHRLMPSRTLDALRIHHQLLISALDAEQNND
jgi:hypothetical protein